MSCSRSLLLLFASLPLVGPIAGCNMTRFTATTSSPLFVRGADIVEQHWDPDLVGEGLPGNILQLEGIYSITPDDRELGIALMRAYGSYAFGWVEDEADIAEAAGDLEGVDAANLRARFQYERARNIGVHLLRLRDEGIDRALRGNPDELLAYLRSHYSSAEDAALLFWTGFVWGNAINVSRTDPEMILALSTARALIEHSITLDPRYYHSSGIVFVATANSAFSENLGGDPVRGRELFERALAETQRHFFVVQLMYARVWAVNQGDRALFVRLLREIIDGGDPAPENRLANRLARRKAIRLLARVDELF